MRPYTNAFAASNWASWPVQMEQNTQGAGAENLQVLGEARPVPTNKKKVELPLGPL